MPYTSPEHNLYEMFDEYRNFYVSNIHLIWNRNLHKQLFVVKEKFGWIKRLLVSKRNNSIPTDEGKVY